MLILQGDCLELLPTLKAKSIDLICTDLPYGTTACQWDIVIPFEPLWSEYTRIIKDTGNIVLFGTQPFTSLLIASNLRMFKYTWVWVKNRKTNFLNAKKQPLRQTEDIIVFHKGKGLYNPQKTIGHVPVHSYTKYRGDGSTLGKTKEVFSGGGQTDRYPSNVLSFPVVSNDYSGEEKLHPTQKPVVLLEYLIKTYTEEGGLVLDSCAGSGTTGVACINTKRDFILMEKDIGYWKVCKERIKESIWEHEQTFI